MSNNHRPHQDYYSYYNYDGSQANEQGTPSLVHPNLDSATSEPSRVSSSHYNNSFTGHLPTDGTVSIVQGGPHRPVAFGVTSRVANEARPNVFGPPSSSFVGFDRPPLHPTATVGYSHFPPPPSGPSTNDSRQQQSRPNELPTQLGPTSGRAYTLPPIRPSAHRSVRGSSGQRGGRGGPPYRPKPKDLANIRRVIYYYNNSIGLSILQLDDLQRSLTRAKTATERQELEEAIAKTEASLETAKEGRREAQGTEETYERALGLTSEGRQQN